MAYAMDAVNRPYVVNEAHSRNQWPVEWTDGSDGCKPISRWMTKNLMHPGKQGVAVTFIKYCIYLQNKK